MSLYHEAAAALTAPASDGGNLKSRIFLPRSGAKGPGSHGGGSNSNSSSNSSSGKKTAPPAQVYALAIEACKWSPVLSEVIDRADLLAHERRHRLSPVLALLLVHDLLVRDGGVQLPAGHGLRAAVERHKARLSAELTRARLRRRAPTLAALRAVVERDAAAAAAAGGSLAAVTRWVRVNTLKTTLAEQLATTFAGWRRVDTVAALWATSPRGAAGDGDASATTTTTTTTTTTPPPAPPFYVDEHVPDLVAVPLAPASRKSADAALDLTRSAAYQSGALVFQDKASCFPAYLLFDPAAGAGLADGGDLVDACAAPGNKTSHLTALAAQAEAEAAAAAAAPTAIPPPPRRQIFAFEKDPFRAQTLKTMLGTAGALDRVTVGAGQDFLRVDPAAARYRDVRALLLDPSCSGSGIVGRDAMPPLVLPKAAALPAAPSSSAEGQTAGKKRKRGGAAAAKKEEEAASKGKGKKSGAAAKEAGQAGAADGLTSTDPAADPAVDPAARLAALAAFQLSLLLHAFRFPAARRITYSTCSVHGEENEQVVVQALQKQDRTTTTTTPGAAGRGRWRLLRRDEQVAGMQAWPVRGDPAAAAAAVAAAAAEGRKDQAAAAEVAEACIRSYPDDGRGVMGFFVAAFVRDDAADDDDDESEWEGIDDS